MKARTILFGVTVIVVIAIIAVGVSLGRINQPRFVNLVVGTSQLQAEVADNAITQARGLSGRESLDEDEAMLFIFEKPTKAVFWMKGMKFPIDIIWLDENWRVLAVAPNVLPETYPQTFSAPAPIRYVIETNAGWASNHSVTTGTLVQLK